MKYTFTAKVRFSEVDAEGCLTPYAMVNYIQDAASFHGEEAGRGVDWSEQTGQNWIITGLRLKILDFPRIAGEIDVSTWATAFRGMVGHRQFAIQSPDGLVTYALAESEWVFFDRSQQKIIRLPGELLDLYGVHPELALKEDLGKRKVHLPSAGLEDCESFVVAGYHLDPNGHMNNGQWVRMALSLLPADYRLTGMRAEFRRQALEGDRIFPCQGQADGCRYVVMKDSQGQVCFLAEFRSDR